MARILLVDDEPTTFEAIKATLEGHELLWAQDERGAKESIATALPGLIILDYLLDRTPSIPGTLVTLRGKLPSVPILVLTGHGSEDVAIQSLRAGAHDYVKKPFDIEDLRRRVTHHLACPPSPWRPSLPRYLIASSRLAIVIAGDPGLRRVIEAWAASGPIPPSLDSLAALAGVSKRQLIRRFRAATGEPPRKYFEGLRVREAAHLLGTVGLSVSEVAARLEFSDASHFSKVFRKYMGVSPGAFQKKREMMAFSYQEMSRSYSTGS